jgi:hypothetical protein
MKQIVKNSVKMALVALFAMVALTFTSCDENEVTLGELPTITLSKETAQNAVNSTETTTLTIKADEGAKSLVILKNGVNLKTEQLNGDKELTFEFTYQLTESIGSVINFTFQVVDKAERVSTNSPVLK